MQFHTTSGIFRLCDWIYRLAYLNILAFIFTIIGGIIAGIFPAITAMFAINKKWIDREDDFVVWKEYWGAYKQYFIQSNIIGSFVLLSGIALYIDFSLVQNFSGFIYYVILSSSATVFILGIVVLLYVFGLLVSAKRKIYQQIKAAIQIGTLFPLQTFWMLMTIWSFLFVCLVIPGLSFLFLGSGLSFIAMYFTQLAFKRMKKYQIKEPIRIQPIEERGVLHGK
ncbi:YesL family protein [Gracilibacillus dipsosauri]|uniref:DUF624 domain-containing protein n=2 Tax=Gracilibacillus dipsosauri TaxID=178340 RepID=A0A317L1H6_9BACI|nr:DUF624 domain-containing protein [Gracilibacillus dipsosauri]PWU69413.1 hypothetical protein DLJ74_05395 [Gracilibacillus dipsosauri]